jgi:hypothetical protein
MKTRAASPNTMLAAMIMVSVISYFPLFDSYILSRGSDTAYVVILGLGSVVIDGELYHCFLCYG